MSYTIMCRNLGNVEDEVEITVPRDEFGGEKRDWVVKFGTQSSTILDLHPLQLRSVVLELTIDKNTDPGQYTIRIRAESQSDSSVFEHYIIQIDLKKAEYGVALGKFPASPPRVDPADHYEVKFKFSLANTGNQDDTYTVEVETPLWSGTYKGWVMEFEDKEESRVDTLLVPSDLKGNTDLYISKNGKVDITLYVTVAIDEEVGDYYNIFISATSDNDYSQADYLGFNLTVVRPNIRVSDHIDDLWIEPDNGIEVGDNVDIIVKVYNDGDVDTGSFFVWFYNGKKSSQYGQEGTTETGLISREVVYNIPAGQFHEVLTTWYDIPYGENDIYVYADKPGFEEHTGFYDTPVPNPGMVAESREYDNTASITLSLQHKIDLRPDLVVIDVDVDDREGGKTTTVTVTIANIGSATAFAGSGTITVKIANVPLEAKTTESSDTNTFLPENIDVGDDIDIEFLWDVPDYGEQNLTIKVVVDHEDDADITNDRYTTFVWADPYISIHHADPSSFFCFLIGALFTSVIVAIFLLVTRKSRRRTRLRSVVSGPSPDRRTRNTAPPGNRTSRSSPPKKKMRATPTGDASPPPSPAEYTSSRSFSEKYERTEVHQ